MPEGSHVDGSPAMTGREVAGYLNVDEKTVYRLAKWGKLPRFQIAGTGRFRKIDIDGWIERQLVATPADAKGKNKR